MLCDCLPWGIHGTGYAMQRVSPRAERKVMTERESYLRCAMTKSNLQVSLCHIPNMANSFVKDLGDRLLLKPCNVQ